MEFSKDDIIRFDSKKEFWVEDVKEGGMGIVYICRKSNYSKKLTAFKTFKSEYFQKNKHLYNSFIKECKIWISLSRFPFIVEAESIETFNRQPFVRMHYYSRNLSDEIYIRPKFLSELNGVRLKTEIKKGDSDHFYNLDRQKLCFCKNRG